MPQIGLCMIVKNESAIIERCLRSVRRLVDYVLIEDTGSTDGTQDIIRAYLAAEELPGEVFDEPWRDFAANRTIALERLRERGEIDYALIMDADDVAVLADDFDPERFRASLEADFCNVQVVHGGVRHWRPHLLSNHQPFCYRGVLHEYVEAPLGSTSSTTDAFYIVAGVEGDRSRDPDKYRKDALALQRALETERNPFLISRYTFYMAQSWRDSEEPERALEAYLRRAELGYWEEEIFVSLLSAARLKEQLDHPAEEVVDTFLRAHRACPHRAEALHGAIRYCRLNDLSARGFALGNEHGLDGYKPEGLFIENWIYEFGLLDEFSIAAYWAGAYTESLDACLKLLSGGKLPESERPRVLDNARFAVGKLPTVPDLGSYGSESLFDQHPLGEPRRLRPFVPEPAPRVLLAILAKQKEAVLPLYLECIEALDYPKSSIVLYIRTNNNTDRTEAILRAWIARVGHQYAAVEFDAEDVADRVQQFNVHEWNATRFKVLARIRNLSLRKTLDHGCQFYFTADVDNFVRPCALRELVALNLPIVAPFLRSINPGAFYSNFHAEVDDAGYYRSCDQYMWVLNRFVRGIIEMPVVHCTYLLRADVLPDLTYEDTSGRHEYVVFSDSARKAAIPQYLDNRQVYGYITFEADDPNYHVEGGIERARDLLESEFGHRLRGPSGPEDAEAAHDAQPPIDSAGELISGAAV